MDPDLRQQLMEARATVRRQIDRLRISHAPFEPEGPKTTVDTNELIARLTNVLREIDDSLAGLRSGDP
jgi:Na+/phosphate symporter